MGTRRLNRRDFLRSSAATLTGALVAACGPATPIVVEKEVIKEVPVEKAVIVEKEVIKEVTKEVPKEIIKEVPVEKEVIKEVEKQVVVTSTPVKATVNFSRHAGPEDLERSLVSVLPGIDVLLSQRLDLIAGRRIGLISNASGVTRDLVSDAEALQRTPDVRLAALFGPEHGFHTSAADGVAVGSAMDSRARLPVHSLFGEVRKPTAAMLDGLDALVFDLQGVGVRFYTYITTLLYTMQASAEHGVGVIVCDRPNPIGGETIEGPLLEPGFESFVGPGPLPIRHGMTMGELARLYNDAWGVGCDLTVVPCAGWQRGMWFDDTGLPWVPASPNMPWPATAVVYPGTCLIEGTNMSEGRGTPLPFHVLGSPWVDGWRLAEALNQLDLYGVHFRPVIFRPSASKWAGEDCGGVQVHVTDRRAFRPVTAGLHLLATTQSLYPEQFAWRVGSGEGRRPYIDLLAGTDKVRRSLDDGASVAELIASWSEELGRFARTSRSYRLYS
jgi:uncharacterized protein YbbC (DUF1343 family)